MPHHFDQIGIPPGTLGDDGTGMIRLPGRIPQHIEFNVSRFALVAFLEFDKARLHNLLRHGQCQLRIMRIAARPEFGSYLKP